MNEEKEENIYDRIRREARESREKREAEQKKRDEFFNSIKNDEITLRGDR
jgi:hypothetical protein